MMAYCPECGSEVAPKTTFCSYCGIALQMGGSIDDTPTEPDAASHNELVKELLPEVLDAEANKSISAPENKIISEIDESVPPTPFVLEQDLEDSSGKFTELAETDSKLEKDRKTFESWSTKTDSIDLDESAKAILKNNSEIVSSYPIQTPIISEPAPIVVTPINPTPVGNLPVDMSAEFPISKPPILNTAFPEVVESPIVEKPQVAQDDDFDNIEKILQSHSGSPYQEIGDKNNPDLSVTIPYTPLDYVSQALNVESVEQNVQPPIVESPREIKVETPLPEVNNFLASDLVPSVEAVNPPVEPETPFKLEVNVGFIDSPIATENQRPIENVSDSLIVPETRRENVGSGMGYENNLVNETPVNPISEPLNILPPPVIQNIQSQEVPKPIVNVNQEPVAVAPPKLNFIEEHPPIIKSESSGNQSYTSPNISTGDTGGNKAKKLKPLEEGTILNGRYEISRKIGGGGMGAVYLASDRNLGGVLRAVKEMVQSSIEDEQQEKAINDFKREATILSGLEHPAIPTIFDYFFDDKEGRFYLVMRYISGGDLAARLRATPEGKIDESTVTDWGIQLADVLNYLHIQEPQIVYRDLKPSNIMIDGNTGRIMLIDFGIARLINSDNADVTAVGTMGYAPPELYRKNVEPRSDIFSLGSTMFHLLTGADPQSNPLLIFDFNKNPRPRQINSQLSDQIEQILMRSVELDCVNRFASAAEMRDILKSHLDNLLKGAVTYGVVAASSSVQAASTLPVFCGFCGQKIVATDQFCPFCGSVQPSAGQSNKLPQVPVYAPQKLIAKVRVIGTNDLDAPEFSLEKETNLVGRRDPMSNIFPEVDLSKFDPQTKISRKHARIWRENDVYMLEDLGSSNGTLIISPLSDSGRLLPRQPHVLANGDKIKVGDTTLHFFVG